MAKETDTLNKGTGPTAPRTAEAPDPSMKILVAEDDSTSRIMLEAVLGKWGYAVTATCDGDSAWAALQVKDAPQLAVLDWMMPGLDGPALCRMLREQERPDPLYLILLTSRSQRQDIVQGLEAGADDFIAKPYDNDELRARVNVGRRMITLQNTLREREKLQGVLEMAGAVCHELNQPLQGVSGYSELLLMDMAPGDPNYETVLNIKKGIERVGELTRKVMNITKYRSKPYMNKRRIIDIDSASLDGEIHWNRMKKRNESFGGWMNEPKADNGGGR